MLYKNKYILNLSIFLSVLVLGISAFFYLYCFNSSSIYGKKIQQTQELADLYSRKNASLFVEKSQYETVSYVKEKAEKLSMKNVTTSFALNYFDSELTSVR